MIMDTLLQFADAVDVTHAAGTILVGDVVDLSKARDIGQGGELYFVITVDTAVLAATAGTIQFKLVSDAQAAIATDGTATEHFVSHAFVTNTAGNEDLTAGTVAVMVEVPVGGDLTKYEQYVGVLAVIATAATTQGKINAFLTPDKHGNTSYPAAI